MKFKVTRKEIKENYNTILKVSYCNLQNMLNCEEPFAYSTRAEGWACDYYDIGYGVVISTGYAPIGTPVNYETCREYEKRAEKTISTIWDYEERRAALGQLIADFREEVTNR